MNEQIARNKRRTFLMLFGFVVVITLAATAIVLLFGGGWVGIVIAFVLAMALAWGSYYNSDKIAIAASRAKPADETEYRRYHNLVEGLCIAAGLPKPKLFVVDDPAPNAFATGRNPKHAAVAVTSGLLEKMNRVELEGVLAHELSHIKNYDILVTTIAVTAVWAVQVSRLGANGRPPLPPKAKMATNTLSAMPTKTNRVHLKTVYCWQIHRTTSSKAS